MKDFHLHGTDLAGYPINVTFRTDAIGNDDENFNISQISHNNEFEPNFKPQSEVVRTLSQFQRTNSSKTALINFAKEHDLHLEMTNSDGSGEVILLRGEESDSESE